MSCRLLTLLLFVAAVAIPASAQAHEVRPGYLEITQTGTRAYQITWKRPIMGDVGIHLTPHLSNGWLEREPRDEYAAGSFLIETWNVVAASPRALDGVTLTVDGLQGTITDVFVQANLADGRKVQGVIRGEEPPFPLSGPRALSGDPFQFLELGLEHILKGPDHLLFVLGLLLIVSDRWMLLKTISAFTVAHSLTLAAATLWRLDLPTPLLNVLIALSILFLAPEIMRMRAGDHSLTLERPWLIAFAFGLLHGLGFASGLASLDLDRGSLAGALLEFNIGVEIGQLAFVGVVLALLRAFRLMEIRWPRPIALAPTYLIGACGAAWTLQYAAIVLKAQ